MGYGRGVRPTVYGSRVTLEPLFTETGNWVARPGGDGRNSPFLMPHFSHCQEEESGPTGEPSRVKEKNRAWKSWAV